MRDSLPNGAQVNATGEGDSEISPDVGKSLKSRFNASRKSDFAAVFQLLADLAGRVDALERRLNPAPAVGDAVRLWFLIRGEQDFMAGELFGYSRTDAGAALRDALVAARVRTSIQLGKRLAAVAGADLDGLTVTRIGENAQGAIWQIRADVCV